MMEYLIRNFEMCANMYARGIIELYLFLVVVLLAYWIRPFVDHKRAAYCPAVVYLTFQTFTNHLETGKETDRLLSVCMIAASVLAAWLLDNRRNPVQKIFLFVVFRLISWLSIEILSEIGFYERDLVFQFQWYRNSIEATVIEFFVWNLIQYGLALALTYVVIRILHKTYRLKHDELTWQEFMILLAPAWTSLLVKPIMYSYFRLWMDGIENGSIRENIPANPYRILFCAFSFLPVVTVIALYQILKEKQEEAFVRNSVEKQIGDTSRHVEHIEELYERMRGLRHDLGNHLTVIEGLAENGSTEELAEYIGAFQKNFEKLQPEVKTGNAVTDVILSEVADRCKKEKISFESAFVYPEKLDISPFDMSVVLTNALQNAIEASDFIPDPVITIKSVQKERVFIINVRNRVSGKVVINENSLPETSKREPGHGYGLKNIRSIAGKYRGDIEIRQEEAEGTLFFVLNIMLMGNWI